MSMLSASPELPIDHKRFGPDRHLHRILTVSRTLTTSNHLH